MSWILLNGCACCAVFAWTDHILRRSRRGVEGLLDSKAEAADELPLEPVVGGGQCEELRPRQIVEHLAGILEGTLHGRTFHGGSTGAFQSDSDLGGQSFGRENPVLARRHRGRDAELARRRQIRQRRMPGVGKDQKRPEILAANRHDGRGGEINVALEQDRHDRAFAAKRHRLEFDLQRIRQIFYSKVWDGAVAGMAVAELAGVLRGGIQQFARRLEFDCGATVMVKAFSKT